MAHFGNSMRMKYIPVHFEGDEIHLAIHPNPKNIFPSRLIVIDEDMSDEYYLEINFKKAAKQEKNRLALEITDVSLYNKVGDVMEYYYWNPEHTKDSWNVSM